MSAAGWRLRLCTWTRISLAGRPLCNGGTRAVWPMVMAMGRGDIKRFGGDGGPNPGIGAGLRGFAKPGGVCIIAPRRRERGRSSGVEHNLAKVGVEGSNPFARSRFSQENRNCPGTPRLVGSLGHDASANFHVAATQIPVDSGV